MGVSLPYLIHKQGIERFHWNVDLIGSIHGQAVQEEADSSGPTQQ